MPSPADFEKLGVFYLGRPYDPQAKKAQDGLLLYDSKDLVTHAVCVGMTGSGKTGLCLALVEEAAIDSIPAILIDPKASMFVFGTEMDYVEEALKSGFVFRNPNEKGRCGCGESFHV